MLLSLDTTHYDNSGSIWSRKLIDDSDEKLLHSSKICVTAVNHFVVVTQTESNILFSFL